MHNCISSPFARIRSPHARVRAFRADWFCELTIREDSFSACSLASLIPISYLLIPNSS